MKLCSPCFAGILSLLLVIACTDARTSLLCLLLISLLLLSTHLFSALLARLKLPCPFGVAAAFSVSIGCLLCPLLRLFFGETALLWPTQPLTAALFLCAGAAVADGETPSPCLPPVLFLLGCLREFLAAGSLWSILLTDFRAMPALADTAGGLLLAAVVTGVGGLNRPVTEDAAVSLPSGTVLMLIGTAIGAVAAHRLPPVYALVAITLFVGFLAVVLPAPLSPGGWPLVAPLAALAAPQKWWLFSLMAALAFAVALPVITGLHQRCRLSGAPRRFAGLPTALGIAGIGCCILRAL